MVEHKEEKKVIGACAFNAIIHTHDHAFLGYALSEKYWSKGYTTEATNELVSFGFKELKLHRVTALISPENIGSIKVVEKIGMKYEFTQKEIWKKRGTYNNMNVYYILDRDFKK